MAYMIELFEIDALDVVEQSVPLVSLLIAG
jgi:hypothetical protein